MELDEIKNYPHKILKIIIDNQNSSKDSYYEFARFKITIPKLDNEIIIFSYDKELSTTISRTKYDDDYFLEIPNVEGKTTIYAHFLISDLYDNTEEDENDGSFVSYDLTKLKDISTSKHYKISDDEHPRIYSILEGSNTGTEELPKDPNYKHYNTDQNNGKNIKGRFPIYSQYSTNNKELVAPNISQDPDAMFTKNNDYVNYSWDVHIHREDIGDIIPKDTNEDTYPINVYLNYEYLPSTTEYHQHFYGFEAHNNTECRDINVFEGDNLETINSNFFGDDNKQYTYRLINVGDKTDHSNAMYVNHSNIKEINITDPDIINNSCEWEKNECDGYYIYTASNDNENRGLYYPIELKADTSYTLKYYVYIPVSANGGGTDCYIDVQSIDESNKNAIITIGTLSDKFKAQDANLTNQWIYHEVPFRTTRKHNRLYIKGHTNTEQDIYFANIQIEEFVKYSPTIKYTNEGVFVIEEGEYIRKPNKDYEKTYSNDNCDSVSTDNSNPKIADITEPNAPYNDIFVNFSDTFDVEYNDKSKLLYCYPAEGYDIEYEDGILYLTHTDEIDEDKYSFEYKDNGDLIFNYVINKVFTYGTANSFTLQVSNEHNENISNRGYVECAITTDTNENADIKTQTVKYLGRRYADDNGDIKYTRLDFTKLSGDKEYFLRIDYYHPCYKKVKHIFKKAFFEEESLRMDITVNGTHIDNHNTILIEHIDEFPLEIVAYVHQKDYSQYVDWGYCELSIDDEVRQTTYVDGVGNAVFYLNKNTDNIKENQVIKIEYYRKYNESLLQDYFTLKLKKDFEGRDAVPIRFNVLDNNITIQMPDEIEIDWNDCLLIDIDTDTTKGNEGNINQNSTNSATQQNQYMHYSIRLYKTENNNKEYITFDNGKTYMNITSTDIDSIVIGDTYIDEDFPENQEKIIKYTVVTDSLINEINNEDITYNRNAKYRQYSKDFTVTWKR